MKLMRFSWCHFSVMEFICSWWDKTPTYFQWSVLGFSFAYLFSSSSKVWSRKRAEGWRGTTGHITHQHGDEVMDRLKRYAHIWVRDVLDRPSPLSRHRKHIQPTHRHLRAVLMPASLLGTALGPEGPLCRRRMGGWGRRVQRRGQRERQVWGRDERAQQWRHSALNVTTVLKTLSNLLAGNEGTGGRGWR